jgi:CBS domain containing-hemolysin-like protein
MVMTIILIKFFMLLLFLLMTAYFAGTETALLSISWTGLFNLKEKNKKLMKCITFWENQPNDVLASLLLGTNLSCIGAGVVSTSIAIDFSKKINVSESLLTFVFTLGVTFLILVFGEILPKVYSRFHSELVCSFGIRPLIFFSNLFRPVTNLLIKLSETIMKIMRIYGKKESPFLTKSELKILLSSELDSQNGVLSIDLSKREKKILTNILVFAERKIRDVMVPVSEIFAVDYNLGLEKIIEKVIDSRYSRVPVYKDSIDNIVGIIYAKDIIITWRNKNIFVLDDMIRGVYFVPENMSVNGLLRDFRTGKQHMAIVVDEYGRTVGLVTVEDLVEEIVGEIYDEYDIREKTIIELSSGEWLIKANESINKVNDELKLNLPVGENFSTVAGLVLEIFGKIPAQGEKTIWNNIKIEIVESDRRRVKKVKLTKIS